MEGGSLDALKHGCRPEHAVSIYRKGPVFKRPPRPTAAGTACRDDADHLRLPPLPLERALSIVCDVAKALAHLHLPSCTEVWWCWGWGGA